MMDADSDILTLGWGCDVTPASLWAHSNEEFVTLDVEEASKDSQEYATLEVAKERDRQYFNTVIDPPDIKCHQNLRLPEWDIMRLDETLPPPSLPPVLPRVQLPAPTPIHPTPTLPPVSVTEFYPNVIDSFHTPAAAAAAIQPYPVPAACQAVSTPLPVQYPVTMTQATIHHTPHPVTLTHYPPNITHHQPEPYPQQHTTYQPQPPHLPNPTFATYSAFVPDPKRHVARSPVSGKFVRGGPLQPKSQATKERKRPGPKTKAKQETEPKPPDEPDYDPEVIANAHLTMDDDYYVCSVCKMKFKQPGNARRHIITVHRNEKNHECIKCNAKFGRKDKLKTHMMRNHGYSADDIKATFKHSGQGRQRSSILVNRDNRKSTESSTSSDTDDSNPLNLKTTGKRSGGKHFNSSKRRKV